MTEDCQEFSHTYAVGSWPSNQFYWQREKGQKDKAFKNRKRNFDCKHLVEYTGVFIKTIIDIR